MALRHLRRRRAEPRVSQDRWLVSYADFITLLFAFFTTLYAISTVDADKLREVVGSMQVAFLAPDATRLAASESAASGPGDVPGGAIVGELTMVRQRLSVSLRDQLRQGLVDVDMDPRGLVISLREAGVFQTGSADLSPEAQVTLLAIADSIRDVGNLVRVEGHTDNVPISTSVYASNWELSTARATNVIVFLVGRGGLTPDRLSAAGYAEFRPRAPNDSDAGRAQNRRVDVIVLNPTTQRAEEP